MRVLRVLIDNSTAVLAWLTSLFGLLTLLEVIQLSPMQVGAIVTFAGATLGLLALFLTVAKRQVVTLLPAPGGQVVAGQAASEPTGTPVATAPDADGTTVAFATVPLAA